VPRDKEKGLAIFEMNEPAMPTQQTDASIRSFGSSGSFAFEGPQKVDFNRPS
jgi:hypothetical protein